MTAITAEGSRFSLRVQDWFHHSNMSRVKNKSDSNDAAECCFKDAVKKLQILITLFVIVGYLLEDLWSLASGL